MVIVTKTQDVLDPFKFQLKRDSLAYTDPLDLYKMMCGYGKTPVHEFSVYITTEEIAKEPREMLKNKTWLQKLDIR